MWLVFFLLKANYIPCVMSVHNVLPTFSGNWFHPVYILAKGIKEFLGRYIATI